MRNNYITRMLLCVLYAYPSLFAAYPQCLSCTGIRSTTGRRLPPTPYYPASEVFARSCSCIRVRMWPHLFGDTLGSYRILQNELRVFNLSFFLILATSDCVCVISRQNACKCIGHPYCFSCACEGVSKKNYPSVKKYFRCEVDSFRFFLEGGGGVE